jgi:single-stranded-DNA-specific exonuclease
MVITDHHELPEHLPEAAALINPRLLAEDHPLASLPGVGVAYKLAESLYALAGREDEVQHLLDLVALGIIADVALLRKDTRFLAQRGIKELRQSKRLGLQKLYELADLNPSGINEEHIGYIIGPRLNALGRLADANKAVEFLTTSDSLQASLLAIELEGLNAQRQLLTAQVYQAAIAQIEHDRTQLVSYALVLGHPTWPAGVIGIVASRLVEQFGKPVVLLSTPPNENARGSARSIEGVNIIAAISAQKELLANFGGHPMAAGLSIPPENIDRFKTNLSKTIAVQIGGELPSKPLIIDAEVSLNDITLDLVAGIEKLAPFGAGNPSPILIARDLTLHSKSTFGRSAEHLTLKVKDVEGVIRPVIWWQGSSAPLPEGKFDLAFSVHATTFQGQPGVQMEWIDAKAQEEATKVQSSFTQLKIEDFRDSPDPVHQLEQIRAAHPDIAVWAEANDKKTFDGKGRHEISPAGVLVIVTTPPSRLELTQVINTVLPELIILLAHDPGMDAFDPFMSRLSGLVKFALYQYEGNLDLDRMAAACAQRTDVIIAGLRYLASKGSIQILQNNGLKMQVVHGDNVQKNTFDSDGLRLRAFLAETKAFRQYYNHTDPAGLL